MPENVKTSGWPERVWRNVNGPDIARGFVPGSVPYVDFGSIYLDGLANEVPIRESGMPLTFTVPNYVRLTVVSTAADVGKTVKIVYLDGTLTRRTETVVLNGATGVNTVAADIRAVLTAYSMQGDLAGIVTFTSGGIEHARIPAGSAKFDTTMQRVPAGKRLMIHSMYAGSTSGTSAARVEVDLVTTFINGDSFADQGYLITYASVGLQDNSVTMSGFPPFPIPAGEWVGFVASSDKSATVTAGFFGWLEDA